MLHKWNHTAVDQKKREQNHNLTVKNDGLFGDLTEDSSQGWQLSGSSEGQFSEIREEPG